MSDNGHVAVVVLVQHAGKLSQRVLGRSTQISLTCGEENTRVEGHLHGIQTVLVLHFLHLGVLHLLSLSLHLVHLLADQGTCRSTDSTANDCADSRVTSHIANNSSNEGTATGTDSCTLLGVVASCDDDTEAECEGNNLYFHTYYYNNVNYFSTNSVQRYKILCKVRAFIHINFVILHQILK